MEVKETNIALVSSKSFNSPQWFDLDQCTIPPAIHHEAMWKLATIFFFMFGALLGAASSQALHEVHENAGLECATCHASPPPAPVPNATCIACHGTMLEPRDGALQMSPDPHKNPHLGAGESPVCSDCHKIHGVSEVTCNVCHRGFEFNIK